MTYDPEPFDRWEKARDERMYMAAWIADQLLEDPQADITIGLRMYRAYVVEQDAAAEVLRANAPLREEPVPHMWSTPTS